MRRLLPRRRPGSTTLRARIVSLAVGAAAVVLVLLAVPLVALEQRSASDDVETTATDVARGVADYLSAGSGVASPSEMTAYVERVNARDDSPPVAVLAPDGTTYGPDLPGAEEQRPTPYGDGDGDADGDADRDGRGDRDGPFLTQSGVDVDRVDGGRLVRLEVRTVGGPTVVLAYAADSSTTAAVTGRLLPLGVAALVVLLLVAGAAELVSRRLVRDLDRTAALADTIAAGDTVARVPESGPPEVRRVAHALNRLAGRIDELLAAERETVADLSHRLRTPMMALRLDVESLPGAVEGVRRLELEDHVDQLERTLTAVIHEARRSEREGARAACRPTPVLAASLDHWRPLIEDQGRAVRVDLDPDLPEVRCADDDLRAAVDALVENVVAHTPDRTPVAVRASAVDGGVRVEVADAGPGFDAAAVHRGRSDRGSTGQGLDIARRCAVASGGEMQVVREDGWTVVRLDLGPAERPAGPHPEHRSI